jgi:hypothetical protein
MIVIMDVNELKVFPKKVIVTLPSGDQLGWLRRVNTDTGECEARVPPDRRNMYAKMLTEHGVRLREITIDPPTDPADEYYTFKFKIPGIQLTIS